MWAYRHTKTELSLYVKNFETYCMINTQTARQKPDTQTLTKINDTKRRYLGAERVIGHQTSGQSRIEPPPPSLSVDWDNVSWVSRNLPQTRPRSVQPFLHSVVRCGIRVRKLNKQEQMIFHLQQQRQTRLLK